MRRRDLRKAAHASGIVVLASSLVALCLVSRANAGTNQFSLVGPDGGHIDKVLLHPTMPWIAYALTQGGYYRSTDSGLTWRSIGADRSNRPLDVAVDPSDPNRVIFAVPGESALVSTDAGATLAHVANFPLAQVGLRQVEFSADGSVVYASSGVRILRSTDSGRNWSERTPVTQNSASQLQFLRVDPLNPDVVYVYDLNQGGFRSTDGGGTWQPLALPAHTNDVAITSTTPQKIWAASGGTGVHVSTDGGASWPVVFPGVAVLSIALDPQDQSAVYAGTSPDGLFRSPDGNGWANVQGNARIGQINSIAVDPLDSTKLMLGGVAGIVVGTPATSGVGGVWERRDTGLRAASASEMSASSASGRIYLNTVNAGVHFLAPGAGATAPVNNEALNQFQHAAVTVSTSGLLAQARGTDRLFVGISNGYVRSDDGGNTWQPGTVGNSDTVAHFADSPSNPDLIVASTFFGFHRSTDGGDTWVPANAGLPSQAAATTLVFSSAAPNTVYAGILSLGGAPCCISHGVYKSVDGGTNWSAANTGFTLSHISALAVDPRDAQIVYAAAVGEGLLKTTNGGASWSLLTVANGQSLALSVAIDPDVPNIVYVGAANRFARSVDAGLTWQELRPAGEHPDWQANVLLADPRRAGTLLMSTATQGLAEITIAPNLALESGGSFVSPVAPGVQQSYRYRLRNSGPFHATGAGVTVTLPADATGVSATTTNGTCVVQGTTATCTAPVLATAATADLVVNATHPAAGTLQVLASVRGDQPDPDAANNEVRYTVAVAQVVNSPPPSGGNGGGGGGTSSWLWLLALAALRIVRSYARPRCFSTSC